MTYGKIDLKIGIPGEGGSIMRGSKITRPKIIRSIENNAGLDDQTKKALVKKLDSYPDSAIDYFYKNMYDAVTRIRQEAKEREDILINERNINDDDNKEESESEACSNKEQSDEVYTGIASTDENPDEDCSEE